jgi:hypothetical protein
MTQLVLFMILAYGFSTIMVYGTIFKGMRDFIHKWGSDEINAFYGLGNFISGIISCMMCCSTWIGFFLGTVLFSPTYQFFGTSPYISWFFDGLFASGAVWAINAFIEWFEVNRPAKID